MITLRRRSVAMPVMRPRVFQIRIRKSVIVLNVTSVQVLAGLEPLLTIYRRLHHVHYVMRIHGQCLRIRKIRNAPTATVTPEGRGLERPILTTHRLQAAMHAMKTRDLQIRIRRSVIVLNVTSI